MLEAAPHKRVMLFRLEIMCMLVLMQDLTHVSLKVSPTLVWERQSAEEQWLNPSASLLLEPMLKRAPPCQQAKSMLELQPDTSETLLNKKSTSLESIITKCSN